MKSERVQNAKSLLMTQNPTARDLDDTSSDDNDDANLSQKEKAKRERARQRAANDAKMHQRRLEDVESVEALRSMQTATLRRLCRTHAIEVYDASKSAKCKDNSKTRRFRSDKALVMELTAAKQRVDSEQHIQSLDDVENEEDIGELQRVTLKRLYKRHRIAANHNLSNVVECLAERKRAPLDDDAAIDSLHDVPFEDIEHLHHDVLLRLGVFHGLKTARKRSRITRTRRALSKRYCAASTCSSTSCWPRWPKIRFC